MTFEQVFKKIESKFTNADLSKLGDDFAIQVNITDEDCGGAFYIQSKSGALIISPYDYRDNTADVTAKKADFYKLFDKKISVDKAMESGALYVNGNKADLESAISCIVIEEKPKVEKKTCCKKTCASKKAPAKKTADKKTK